MSRARVPELMDVIDYRIELVGGPHDGAGGMRWRDDGEHAPPKLIRVGVCPGDGSCSAAERCRTARKHVYFWLPEESSAPPRTLRYELQDSFLMGGTPDEVGHLRLLPAQAIYVIGGLLLPDGGGLSESRSPERELELIGAGGTGHERELEEA